MALTLDATPKGASANSYITRADADTYFEGRMNASAWTSATDSNKDLALVAATNRLEAISDYLSYPTDTNQRLRWPRIWVVNEYGGYYDPDVIPRLVQEACCEEALRLLNTTGDPFVETGLEPYTNVKVGSLDVTPDKGYMAGDLSPATVRLLAEFRSGSDYFRTVRA